MLPTLYKRMDKHFFYQLADKYLDGTATPEEQRLVEAYYEQLSSEESIKITPEKKQTLKELIYQGIQTGIQPVAPVIPIRQTRRVWLRIAAAAVITFALAGTTWFALQQTKDEENIAALPQTQRFQNDIDPARQGAVLTLDDGSKILLDSAGNGTLASQGNMQVIKEDGSVTYTGNGSSEILYNTIATNKGKDYHLTLADGTQVWLDALSSIHFPTAFAGNERIVEVTGQVYFEVAKNPAKPFKVKAGDQEVEVLGTHFNINAYDASIKTTLLEGSVRIKSEVGSRKPEVLKPGQQAQFDKNNSSSIRVIHDLDIDEVMAWKNGRFNFNGASMEEIMTQLSRWYDIEIVYKDKVAENFVAKISRDVPLSRLLALLEMTKQVSFSIEGKKVTVWNVAGKTK